MKYKNAAEILPEKLLEELQTYISGEILYVPQIEAKKEWGSVSGSRHYYIERNKEIKARFKEGKTMEELAKQYGLANSTIKKIIYPSGKEKE